MIRRWRHEKRGIIVGEFVSEEHGYTTIKLQGNQVQSTISLYPIFSDGEEITVRTKFLTEETTP